MLATHSLARRMAEYVESKEKSQKSTLDTQKAKLAALEKQLGIQASSSSTAGLGAASASSATTRASQPSAASGSTPSASAADVDVTKIAQKRHRFEDNQYFETSREINDGVRNAVTAGMCTRRSRPVKKLTFFPFPRSSQQAKEGQGRARQGVRVYDGEARSFDRGEHCRSQRLSASSSPSVVV
jgi:hypothetical protein